MGVVWFVSVFVWLLKKLFVGGFWMVLLLLYSWQCYYFLFLLYLFLICRKSSENRFQKHKSGSKSIQNHSKIEENRSWGQFGYRNTPWPAPGRSRYEKTGLSDSIFHESGGPRLDLVARGKIPLRVQGKLGFREEFPLSEASTIFCRCLAERVPEGLTCDQKWNQHGPKWGQKGAKGDQNGAKREPTRATGTSKGPPAERYIDFWCQGRVPTDDFGTILAPFLVQIQTMFRRVSRSPLSARCR